jgi:hypothetical protein
MALPTVIEARGVVEVGLGSSVSVAVGDLLGFNGTDWVKADSDAGVAAELMAMVSTSSNGLTIPACKGGVLFDSDAPYTLGAEQYLGDTAGAHAATAGLQRIGRAISTSLLAFDLAPRHLAAALISLTAATHTIPKLTAHDVCYVANRAAGITVTLPDATGSGQRIRIVVGTAITSNALIVAVPDANNVMCGIAHVAQDGGDTTVAFEAGATADTITMNGSTTGGLKGDVIELVDIGADLWWVSVRAAATGTEATPFSAAV